MLPNTFAIGPLGTWEMLIIAALVPALVVGGVVFLVIYLDKKK